MREADVLSFPLLFPLLFEDFSASTIFCREDGFALFGFPVEAPGNCCPVDFNGEC
jgi:hypothetical protein